MWHICGSHAGSGVQGTVPLMKGQGTWLSGTTQMPSAPTHPGIPGAGTVASELQSEHKQASVPFLPQCPLLTDLPWTEVVVDFSSYSFLRLRWRDKVLGGKPNSRLQGCHILALTETNPKTEEGRGERETKGLWGQEVIEFRFQYSLSS